MIKNKTQQEIDILTLFHKRKNEEMIEPIKRKNNEWVVGDKPKVICRLYLITVILNIHKIGIKLDFYHNHQEMWSSGLISTDNGFGIMRDNSRFNILAYMPVPMPYFHEHHENRPEINDKRWIMGNKPANRGCIWSPDVMSMINRTIR